MHSILISILTSLVSSFIFLFLVLLILRPRISISPVICKGRLNQEDKNEYFFIKIVNHSLFSAFDVKCELIKVDTYNAENGKVHTRNLPINLVTGNIQHIPSFRPDFIRKGAPYAIRIRSEENLNSILNNDYKSIVIKVFLRHGLSGLAKVVTKEYTDISQIVNGRFKFGKSFEVIKNNY